MLLSQIAAKLGLDFSGEDCEITAVNSLEKASETEISFFSNPRYIHLLNSTKARAVIVSEEFASKVASPLISKNPYVDFGRALSFFAVTSSAFKGISEQAHIRDSAVLGENVTVYPFAYIADNAKIGRGTIVFPGCYVGEGCTVGEDCVLFPNVTMLAKTVVGNNCRLYAGVVLGADGFGFIKNGDRVEKIPQIGTVVIEDNVEIGANTTIDRAVMHETRVGKDSKIDNLVQLGHNVTVGERSLIISQVAVAGSTQIGDDVIIAGKTAISGHLKIGNKVTIAPMSGIAKSIADGQTIGGIPGMEEGTYLRVLSLTPKLPEAFRRLRKLEKEMEELKEQLKNQISK